MPWLHPSGRVESGTRLNSGGWVCLIHALAEEHRPRMRFLLANQLSILKASCLLSSTLWQALTGLLSLCRCPSLVRLWCSWSVPRATPCSPALAFSPTLLSAWLRYIDSLLPILPCCRWLALQQPCQSVKSLGLQTGMLWAQQGSWVAGHQKSGLRSHSPPNCYQHYKQSTMCFKCSLPRKCLLAQHSHQGCSR